VELLGAIIEIRLGILCEDMAKTRNNKNGLVAVAMLAGKGDMSLFRDSDVLGTSSSRDCRITFSRC